LASRQLTLPKDLRAFVVTNQGRIQSAVLISICRKCATKHWGFTLRLFLSGFVLNDIPVLYENSVLYAHNICGNPIHGSSKTAESSVHDHEVSLSYDRSRLVLQRWWKALDEIEQTLTARAMCAQC